MNNRDTCYTIGLTGGIASGKSAVSALFEDFGSEVIDADIIARQVVELGTPGLLAVREHFGDGIINDDGHLDRSALRKLVFNDEAKLTQLNDILHPLIRREIQKRIQSVTKNHCIVVIPLLCESRQYDWLDRVLVVDVPEATQLQRLMKRDGVTQALAQKMMDSQCSRQQRLKIADDVVKNDRSLTDLNELVQNLYRLYKHY